MMSFFEPKMPKIFLYLKFFISKIEFETRDDPPTFHSAHKYHLMADGTGDARKVIYFYNLKRLYALRAKWGDLEGKKGLVIDLRFKNRENDADLSSFYGDSSWDVIESWLLDSRWRVDEEPFELLVDMLQVFKKDPGVSHQY